MRLSAQILLLALSLGSTWFNGLFAFTDQAWLMMGSQPEFYPEWSYIFVGFPLAITALMGASAWLATSLFGHPNLRLLWLTLVLTCAGLALSSAAALIPFTGDVMNLRMPQWFGNLLFLGSPFVMTGQIVLGLVLVIGAAHRKSAT